mgnify:CR=1 FL=1
MSGRVFLDGYLEVPPKRVAAVAHALPDHIALTRAEPGCIEYWLHQDDDDPAEFTFYENWTNRAEWDKHMEMPHLKAFADVRDRVFALQKLRLMTMIGDPVSAR